MFDWIVHWITHHKLLVMCLTIFSVVFLLISVFMLPVIIINLPADYFKRIGRAARPAFIPPVVYVILLVIRNMAGIVLILLGLLMLVLPGQGIVTILIGLMILDLPGEKKLLVYFLHKTNAVKAMNWLRRKNNRPPLELPPHQ